MRIDRLSLVLLLLAGCGPTEGARSLPGDDEGVRISAEPLSAPVEPLVLPSASAASAASVPASASAPAAPVSSGTAAPPSAVPSPSASGAAARQGGAVPVAAAAPAGGAAYQPVPGKCGPIPPASFYILRFRPSSTHATARWTFSNLEKLDFDGDGTLDVMVPQPPARGAQSACSHDIEWDLYLRRKGCGGVYAGRVRGMPEKVSEKFGRRILETVEDNVGPMRNPTTFQYVLFGTVFRLKGEHTPNTPTRCQVHPADCVSMRCQLAGHPRGGFDYLALDEALRVARKEAEKCGSKVSAETRCSIDLLFSTNSGKARVKSATGCGAAEACVRAALESIQVSPYTASLEQTAGLSFVLKPDKPSR